MFNFKFNKETGILRSIESPEITEKDIKIPGDDYKEKLPHPQSGDPLYTKTGMESIFREGANHKNTKDIAAIDYLEEMEANHTDPSYQFKTGEDVVDPSDLYQDFENEEIFARDCKKEVEEKDEITNIKSFTGGEGLVNGKTEDDILEENESSLENYKRILEEKDEVEKAYLKDGQTESMSTSMQKGNIMKDQKGDYYMNADAKNAKRKVKTNTPFKPHQTLQKLINKNDFGKNLVEDKAPQERELLNDDFENVA